MQVPAEIRKCVAFLACRRNSGYVNGGTCFFVGYPFAASKAILAIYAVTARHVIEEIGKRSDGNVYCRVDSRNQGTEFLAIPLSQWHFSDDSRIDVAVAPLALDLDLYDHRLLPVEMLLTSQMVAEEGLGVGDELFFPGLFTQRPGEMANLPIIRIGNIAAMPEEAVSTQWGALRPPYLVEARSIGGLSGSPVFWYRRGSKRLNGGLSQFGNPTFLLLGLVHGHYADKGSTWDTDEETVADSLGSTSINMGIAIVVPAEDILATLNLPCLQQQRDIEHRRLVAVRERNSLAPSITPIFEPFDHCVVQEETLTQAQIDDGLRYVFRVDTMEPQGDDIPRTRVAPD